MILWNLGSWYDVANCCNNCFGYGMNSSTVSDCNWLRATTGCYYVQGYGSKKAKAVPCAASTRFVIFCMIFQCWNTCASCIPLVYFSLCSRSSHCMGGLALHSRFSFDIFFVLFQHAVVQAWASVFRRGGIVGHWAVFSESNCAMTCAMKSLSHYDNVHWLHRSSRSSSSHTWHVFISCCFLGWVLGMTWYMSILYLHWHKYIHTHVYIYNII